MEVLVKLSKLKSFFGVFIFSLIVAGCDFLSPAGYLDQLKSHGISPDYIGSVTIDDNMVLGFAAYNNRLYLLTNNSVVYELTPQKGNPEQPFSVRQIPNSPLAFTPAQYDGFYNQGMDQNIKAEPTSTSFNLSAVRNGVSWQFTGLPPIASTVAANASVLPTIILNINNSTATTTYNYSGPSMTFNGTATAPIFPTILADFCNAGTDVGFVFIDYTQHGSNNGYQNYGNTLSLGFLPMSGTGTPVLVSFDVSQVYPAGINTSSENVYNGLMAPSLTLTGNSKYYAVAADDGAVFIIKRDLTSLFRVVKGRGNSNHGGIYQLTDDGLFACFRNNSYPGNNLIVWYRVD